MKRFLLRILFILISLLIVAGGIFLAAPYIIDTFLVPRALERIALIDKSASVSKVTPFSARGTISFEDGDIPIASIPRFDLKYSPLSLFGLRAQSLTIDHGTIHLSKVDGVIQFPFPLPSDPTSTRSNESEGMPLLFPIAIDELLLKECSIVLHESGKPDIRFTLSARIVFQFDRADGSNFNLISADGSFLLSDSMKSRGTFSLATGEAEHAVSFELQTELEELPAHLVNRRADVTGSLRVSGSVLFNAQTSHFQSIDAHGTIEQFQLSHPGVAIFGSDEGASVSFSMTGSPEQISYQCTAIGMNEPLAIQASIRGTGRLNGETFATEGVLLSRIEGAILNSEEGVSLPLVFRYLRNNRDNSWRATLEGEYQSNTVQVVSLGAISLKIPDFSIDATVDGTTDSILSKINLSTKPFSFTQGTTTMEVSGLELSTDSVKSSDSLTADIVASITHGLISGPDLDIAGISLILPLSFPLSFEHEKKEGQFSIESVAMNGISLFSVSSIIEQQQSTVNVSAAIKPLLTDASGSSEAPEASEVNLSGTLDLNTEEAELSWSLADGLVTSTDLTPFVPTLTKMDFTSSLSSTGAVRFQNRTLSGDAAINLVIDTFTHPDKNVSVEAISCGIRFPDLPKFASEPSQRCSVETITFGNLNFSDAIIDFRIEDIDTLFIEKSSVRWCQGKLESTSLRLSRNDPSINTILYSSRINFSDLLNQFGLDQAEGKGTLNGKLPIELTKDGLFFDDGFLFSTPGTGGIIRFSNTDMLRQGVGVADLGGYLDYSMMAMEDFAYDWTKLSFNSSGDELLMTMELNGKPRNPLPYGFKNGRIVETDKGSGLQYPIQLDVNFRLPLAELFQIGQNIQSLKENM